MRRLQYSSSRSSMQYQFISSAEVEQKRVIERKRFGWWTSVNQAPNRGTIVNEIIGTYISPSYVLVDCKNVQRLYSSEHPTIIIVSGVRLSPLGTATTTGLLNQPQIIDEGDCGEICGIKIGRGNRNTRRKPGPAPICPPQIPHD
jgi:hypothetical protein